MLNTILAQEKDILYKIYIVKIKPITYDDQYYYFDKSSTSGDIYSVFISKEIDIATIVQKAKAAVNSLYNDYSEQLDDIEWQQYYNAGDSEEELTEQGKLCILQNLCYQMVDIQVYEQVTENQCELRYIEGIELTQHLLAKTI